MIVIMDKSILKIDWCSHEAAKYAVENWHYSQCMPRGKIVKVGAWEEGKYIGCVLFSRGTNKSLGAPFGLEQVSVCELTRVALNKHKTPVSRILKIAISFLRKSNPGIKLIVSFADTEQGHHGGIYQAGGWVYTGVTNSADEYLYKGRRWHGRAFRKSKGSHLNYLDKGLTIVKGAVKHRYVMALDEDMKEQIEIFRKPNPKRVTKATSGYPPESGGAIPTHALQFKGGDL